MRKVLLKGIMFAAAFAVAGSAIAATKVSVSCTTPTTRTSGIAMAASEIKDYSFWWKQPNLSEVGPSVVPACSFVVNIAEGTCLKAGTVFSGAVTDTDGQMSDRGSATLAADACNPKSRPAAPSVTITVQ